jgi:hypothetical protein
MMVCCSGSKTERLVLDLYDLQPVSCFFARRLNGYTVSAIFLALELQQSDRVLTEPARAS